MNSTADYADAADLCATRRFSLSIRFIRVSGGSGFRICESANESAFWLTVFSDQQNSIFDSDK
jgi:hypothetical protein